MHELIIPSKTFSWVPECLEHILIQDVVSMYFDFAGDGDLPNINQIVTEVIDPVAVQVESYMLSEGKDLTLETTKIINITNYEEQDNYHRKIIDKHFDGAFMDMEAILQLFHLSFCYTDEKEYIRGGLHHYNKEVW